MKKITKILTGVSTFASGLYWGVLPTFAASTLCPEGDTFSKLCNTPSVENIIGTVINVLLFVAFVAALGYLIFGGIRWIMSGGDKEGTAKAKGTVTAALIGLVIVLAAWILLSVVTTFFGLGPLNQMKLPTVNWGAK